MSVWNKPPVHKTTTPTPPTQPTTTTTLPTLSKIRQLQRTTTTEPSSSSLKDIHPLRQTWVFYCRRNTPGHKIINYEKSVLRIGAFSSIEDFWAVYTTLKPTDSVSPVTEFHLFKAGIKPTFEDPSNKDGGKWSMRLKKGVSGRMWEDLVLFAIGDHLPLDVCGMTCSVRQGEDVLTVWNKSAGNGPVNLKIRNLVRSVVGDGVEMEYIVHGVM